MKYIRFLTMSCSICILFLSVSCKKISTSSFESSDDLQEKSMAVNNYQQLLATVAIGDSYEKIIKTFGEPGYENELVLKEKPVVVGKSLIYLVSQKDPRVLNEKTDKFIQFNFDKNNKLSGIFPNNIK